ncbi:TPR and ankyrin repeat-containing protein 1 [Carex littledalei]|uniref:TPR and ankyrin repeat-containing protein 1 n=1 Tax=Carex littledalei TaxID=544730 RepID=A0A833QHA4_9POAL|nr:TPR and ankyrin repeat-containing protein 1 [Carex littledalei]
MDEIVLSWQIEDICNRDLYKDQVQKIPDEFQSINEYLESYTLPLIEETREEFYSGLETISEAPCAKIQDIALRNTKFGLVCDMDIPADGFAGETGSTDKYEPKNGDVFILSSLKPESINDLLRYGVSYNLAIVKKVVEVELEVELEKVMTMHFTMSVSPTMTSDDEIQRCTFALYLASTVTNSRIWRALHNNEVDRNFTLLKKVLSRNQMEESLCGSTNAQNNPEMTRLLDQLLSINLNQSQLKAVKSTISDVRCNKLSSINLVWGPPGTGKTKTVGSILWALRQLKIRTLTCAPTNVAVLGVCSRLVQLLKNFNGNNGDSIEPPLSLADVVLFGNRGRMDIVGDLEDVFLDSRIDRLENCFLSETNWRCGVASMIHFLEDCVNMYDVYVAECEKDNRVSLGFGDYLRQQFKELQKNLSSCFQTMFVHLPRRFLSSENCTRIVSLTDLLRELSGMLSSSVITDEQLKQTFGTTTCIFSAQKKLLEAREECLKQLRNLNETLALSISSLTDGGSIRDFCLQNATLVFCTASSSFLLHNARTSCFDVVVIDEAAQLKECESVIPLRLNHVKHALLVGDEYQLPALVQSRVSKRAGFGRSLFERLVSLQHEKHLLNIQYRMHPSISLFPNNRFYDGQILNGPNVLEEGYNNNYLDFKFGSYAFLHIADGREESDEKGKSWINWVEVAVIVHLIKNLYESWTKMNGKLTVGIISPYAAQVRTIKDKVGRTYDNREGFEVRVKSIDGFQGQEDDVIILSMVRCNTKGSVGFLYDNQRTNVAITRARHCLWIVGSESTMSNSGTVWSEIVFDAKRRGHLFDAKDVEDLENLILNVKNELDQLADLMNPNSVLFSSTRWKVVFSDEFLRSFARLRSKTTRMGLIQMLLRLAGGWRSKRRNLSMAARSFPLARVYAVAEHYLVWSIDLQKDQQVCNQIIKLWNLVPLADVEGLLKRMDYIFSMYTDAYMERCKTIFLEETIEVPMMWTDGHEITQYRKNNQHEITGENQDLYDTNSSFLEDSKVNESLVLMRFYALSSGVVKHLLMARDGSDIDIPFELNDQEMEIIRFPNSSFILGRSGTGKTTVLTTKLVRMEQQFFVASHGMCSSDGGPSGVVERGHENEQMEESIEVGFVKQIFLTVSPKLCSAIRDQVNRLVRFANFGELSGPIDSVTMHDVIDKLDEFADIPDNFIDLTQDHYPLIITFRKFLLMLDGTIGFSFFNKFYSDWGASMEQGVSKSHTLQTLIQSKEVDFDKFYGSYWPRFNEQLTKNLDASTVFTQIISNIKGEFRSIEGAIGREQYVALSEKRFSSLSSAIRERVYEIFLEYEKKKRAAREFDLSDFVNDLHSRLNTAGYLSCKVDFIYIDEVQDLTVSQIALLKYICNNFQEGFIFAGDTAQTIARGIDFRFEDIRSLFYKEFLSKLKGKEKETRLSDMFQLCQNFRTHIGVLKLAQSVIDLLYYFFPLSIDKLNPETSLIFGDAPVLLESGDDENAITKIFGESKSSGRRTTEFGAEQVILVRDDSTKREVLEIVGKRALVLTIIDCKGLEFQDVLLYNFFGSSPLENKWRVLYAYLENEDLFDPSMTRSYPSFDIASHYLLCSELKQLYVAITRTKQRLWICENSMEFGKPMFHYWKRLCLVQGTQLDMNFVDAMRTASTPDDWRVRGIKLFNERQFEMARMCFEKAGDVYNETWARAAGLVEMAERHFVTNLEKANCALQKAADLYETIRMYDKAATCYIKLGNYAKAGTIYLEKCGTSRLEDAGDCFDMIKCWPRAADAYFQANCFSKCTSACLKGELFDAGLKYLDQWQLEEEKSANKWKFGGLEAARDNYIKNCANHFSLRGDSKNMMHFVKAFKSMEEIRTFLMAKMFLDELLTLELEAGNFIEAAKIARMKEDLLLEALVWEKAGSFEKATQLVILDVIMESLWSHGSKGWPPKSFPKSEVHFTKAKGLAKKVSNCFYNSVCSELYIWDDKPKTFSKLSKLLHEARMKKNTRLTFLSLRSLLDLHLTQENSGYLFEAEPLLDLEKWFHEMMAQGRVSLNTLIHIWVQWREAATEVSSSLYELSRDYLGVRKEDNDGTYCVLNPNAWWIGGGVRASLKKSSSGRYLMTSEKYTSSATSYWKSEIFDVGKAVVAKLDSLLRSSSKQTLSPETRGRISLSVYQIIKSLKETSSYKDNNINFQSYMFSVDEWFWDAIFPWDSKNRATQGVLPIIDCPAAAELVDESVDRFLSHVSGKFTYGQLGKLSMILLLSGKLPANRSAKIMQCTENMQEWREFFASLEVLFNSGFERMSMVVNFQKALQATYNVDWKREPDYMSPHCYLYLLELLTFFASSCLGSSGYMITTRSVLAEIMKLRGCKNFLDQMVPGAGPPSNLLSLFEFIVHSVKELLCNKSEMCKWIDRCCRSLPEIFYRQMILRLAIMLHMPYLNMSLDIHSAGKFLSSRYDISRDLPGQFCSKLSQARNSKERDKSLIAFVDAFASVGDPLVIISTKEDNFVFPPSNFLFFCCDKMRDKDHVMSVLFPSTGPDVTPSMVSCTNLPSTTAAADVTEGTQDGQGNAEERLVKMLEAFKRCEKKDIAGTVDILGVLLLWLRENKSPMGFYDQLVEETRIVYDHFEKINFPAKETYSYPSLEALYSYWQDGEAKLNLIIDTLISEKTSKEASERDATLEQRKIVAPTVVVKKEVDEDKLVVDTPKELFWVELEAFQQRSYQKDDLKSIANLLLAALSLLDENESLRSFDEHLIEEMKSMYNSFSDLLARGDGPTLEDLYSRWPHGEIKLKLIIDTLLTAHERNLSDDKEASERRPVENKVVEENAVAQTGLGTSSKPNINKQKGKKNKKSKKRGKKNKG